MLTEIIHGYELTVSGSRLTPIMGLKAKKPPPPPSLVGNESRRRDMNSKTVWFEFGQIETFQPWLIIYLEMVTR